MIWLALAMLVIIGTLTTTKWTDHDYFSLFKFGVSLGFILMLIASIYGAVIVFGMYNRWSSDILEWYTKDTQMQQHTFILAFVMLILQWIFIPITCILITKLFALIPETNNLIRTYNQMPEE